ncbi:oligopeptide transporter, OPT family [Cystobacter fuscus DSM 2262]|uniref:Oligopeptide transporter, OPT family n=1 Tax=Cystobacter fuscus (strain ATCC 25194 / DSM 2262 / NBRC 100088 / M29) TaxID=1242864 RepID=S9PPB4_CYSF2|nr:OPT/YSL family transporter [Cystobacter fuscus]EPX64886.1 oligopeptide transporter, OPT family [Cystobacter fuscus DSM 2262]
MKPDSAGPAATQSLQPATEFQPYIPAERMDVAEFTPKAVIIGVFFGIIFGAATVYLALKAGLTVSASIPIAVLAISLLKKLGGSTILENNVVQTIGSAGESIAAGVVFTLPGFLFLSPASQGASFFEYWTIFTLALLGGVLGTLMMVPLRRSLIVKEHANLPYPEGTACASVLIAGEKGGDLAKIAFQGVGFAFVYALLQKIVKLIAETPGLVTKQTNRFFPSATLNGDITPEYLGVGYIVGPKIAGVLVAGGVLAWLGLIPLLATLVPGDTIAEQLVKLGYLQSLTTAGGPGGWDPATHTFRDTAAAIYRAYVRQIGAGAVAAGGFITLLKTLPTIVSAFQESLASFKEGAGKAVQKRTENDLPITVVLFGSAALILVLAVLPFLPGSVFGRLMLGILIVVFGFFFVTVASRIVGIIGSSSNPISGMTIATLMATCLIFIGIGWTGDIYQPMALCVGGMVCIAAANAGATSQDLKTGYLVGATPRAQQIGLMIGAVAAAIVIGLTMKLLDTPTEAMRAQGILHRIGTDAYPAPQGTLMATLIKGLLSFNLDWQFVLVGVFLSVTMELCGVKSLSFAVGAYLPLSTTAPIFVGGAIKGLSDFVAQRKGEHVEESELGPGNLFSTGLVAGGALAGVVVAMLSVYGPINDVISRLSVEHALTNVLGAGGYQLLGVLAFAFMCFVLYRVSRRPSRV